MRNIAILLLSVLAFFSGCQNEPVDMPSDGGNDSGTVTVEEYQALSGYLSAFGHVRVLGDIDHLMKGEVVDDEEGVTVQSMTTEGMTFSEDGKTLTIPLTLTAYDFDGHRNGEDDAYLYTRIATGTLTLVLAGETADGVFSASSYAFSSVDVTLDCADVEGYMPLGLPELSIVADEVTGFFTESDGYKLATVDVAVTDGKAAGIVDVNTPKFKHASGTVLINGHEAPISLI